MADHESNEKWFEGKSSLFKSRAERVKADIVRRKAGRMPMSGYWNLAPAAWGLPASMGG